MDYSLKEVAGRIKDLREAKGYSVEELAKLTGVSVEDYKLLEAGETTITEKIVKFGKIYNFLVHFIHFGIREAQQGAIKIDIFVSSKFIIETYAEFNKRNKIPIDNDIPFFWIINSGENF